MRHTAVLLGAILIVAWGSHAQVNPNYSLPEVSSAPAAAPASTQEVSPIFAVALPPAFGAAETPRAAVSPSSDSDSAQQVPSVYGVFQNYNWQLYGGYSFIRLYISKKPSFVENMNGLDIGLVYYPKGWWIGVDGDFVGEFGTLIGDSSRYALALGGPRFRWSAPRGLEIWGHGMVGGAHLTPRTALGNEDSFAYEVGGGVDVGAHHRRISYRLEADMVGSRFFGTYQYSPRITAGVVFKY